MQTLKPNSMVRTPAGPGRAIVVRADGKVQVALHTIPAEDQRQLSKMGMISNVRIFDADQVKELK